MNNIIKKIMWRLGNNNSVEISRSEMFQLTKEIKKDDVPRKAMKRFIFNFVEEYEKRNIIDKSSKISEMVEKLKTDEITKFELMELVLYFLEGK